jgi:N-acetylglucosamine-6-sulfatase
MMTTEEAAVVTGVYKNRWRTLMSVDDVIADVVATVEKLGLMDNTYFFYTSDHGFQLGEFNIPMDKRQPYDFDTRIHLLVRGPGIKPGSTWNQPATQVDLAPTFLGLAGVSKPPQMDGHSLVPLLMPNAHLSEGVLPVSTKKHLSTPMLKGADSWRDAVFIEYYYNADNDKCMESCHYPSKPWPTGGDTYCTNLTAAGSVCWGGSLCTSNCYPTESIANNFIVLRSIGSKFGNSLYVEFETGNQNKKDINFKNRSFVEYFELDSDPWMMKNVAKVAGKPVEELHEELMKWFTCKGSTCP